MEVTAASISEFVSNVPLPDSEPAYEAAPPDYTASDQALTIGSQLSAISSKVDAGLRAPISNGLLLAQLAADKAASSAQDVVGWYDAYRTMLGQLGWRTQALDMQAQDIGDANLSVNKAIIPVITALLGPQVAAAAIVIAVLNGLKDMDNSSPWITLFNKASQHASGAKFQVSYVDVDGNGQPQVTLAALAINATRTITQILFFKFSSESARLMKGNATLSTTADILTSSAGVIEQRVADYVGANIMNMKI
jgi:hypothetical protein